MNVYSRSILNNFRIDNLFYLTTKHSECSWNSKLATLVKSTCTLVTPWGKMTAFLLRHVSYKHFVLKRRQWVTIVWRSIVCTWLFTCYQESWSDNLHLSLHLTIVSHCSLREQRLRPATLQKKLNSPVCIHISFQSVPMFCNHRLSRNRLISLKISSSGSCQVSYGVTIFCWYATPYRFGVRRMMKACSK